MIRCNRCGAQAAPAQLSPQLPSTPWRSSPTKARMGAIPKKQGLCDSSYCGESSWDHEGLACKMSQKEKLLRHGEEGRRGERHEKKEARPTVCPMTKRDEAGAQITMAVQFGEASAAVGPTSMTRCLSVNAERVGWMAVGKGVLVWARPRPGVWRVLAFPSLPCDWLQHQGQ